MLRTGKTRKNLKEGLFNVNYELIIPYRASRAGKINCMQCHNVEEGEVLGAVSITMDLTDERSLWLHTLIITAVVSLLFFVGTLYMIVAFFKPYTDFFSELRTVFGKIEKGDFSRRIDLILRDEAGAVAHSLNNMMDRLSRTLSGIRVKVAHLIGHPLFTSGNAVQDTALMVDELVKIYNFKRTIENDTNVHEIYLRIESVLKEMHVEYYSIYSYDQDTRHIKPVVSSFPEDWGISMVRPDQAKDHSGGWCIHEPGGKIFECRACRTGSVVDSSSFPDVCQSFRKKNEPDSQQFFHYCIPFYLGGQVGGVVQVVHTDPEKKSIQSDIYYLKSYLQEAGPVIEAKTYMNLLKQQSMIDRLTGMYNRRYLDEHLTELESQASDRSVGVMMIDIDHFKSVNDEFGHDVGDVVLEQMSEIIRKSVRQSDVLIRYGGEEILVLLMDTATGHTHEVAEKIRSTVEITKIEAGHTVVQRTISIGVAEYPTHADEFQKCLKMADMALYHAKETGRNQVIRYEDLPESKKETL